MTTIEGNFVLGDWVLSETIVIPPIFPRIYLVCTIQQKSLTLSLVLLLCLKLLLYCDCYIP